MRLYLIPVLYLLAACSGTGPEYSAQNLQCVPYARNLSGIQIYGDAHSWWHKAPKQGYQRGWRPAPGAVLVLAQTRRLRHGHVAVVRQIFGPRQITVSHANWGKDYLGRGLVYPAMRVIDVSQTNNWTQLRFQTASSAQFGSIYPAKGFIYPRF